MTYCLGGHEKPRCRNGCFDNMAEKPRDGDNDEAFLVSCDSMAHLRLGRDTATNLYRGCKDVVLSFLMINMVLKAISCKKYLGFLLILSKNLQFLPNHHETW